MNQWTDKNNIDIFLHNVNADEKTSQLFLTFAMYQNAQNMLEKIDILQREREKVGRR